MQTINILLQNKCIYKGYKICHVYVHLCIMIYNYFQIYDRARAYVCLCITIH